ncbi:ZIP family metal transporter [Bacillus sp. FJAT-49711]|uniref:ZIP family metal transporter n=1 Tax=Bacillus sp. FJAT-49711 TaxID=2833585 RepID=UPI001BC9C619|nr:ZIP family metal transporter [Bacillus sp. FJAT-49711]MBS4220028.1 ZIP family metal transporter [Bacillus sp. FJAT-49711]
MGLSAGGLLTRFINHVLPKKLPYAYVICGGILAGIIIFDLIPHSIKNFDFKGIFLGVFLGYTIMLFISHFLPHEDDKNVSEKTVAFLIIAIFFHHIIMGFSYGATELSHNPSFLTAIIFHQIPEGIAIMITLLIARVKTLSFIYIITILSIVFGISALLGQTFKDSGRGVDTLLTGGALGTLIFVTFNEIIGKSKNHFGWISLLLMIAFGVTVIIIYHSFLVSNFT